MTKWLTKREEIVFDYSPGREIVEGSTLNELHNFLAKHGQEGWEPWHMNSFVALSKEHISVWFKRPDETS